MLCGFKYLPVLYKCLILCHHYEMLPKEKKILHSLIFEPILLTNTEKCQGNTTQKYIHKTKWMLTILRGTQKYTIMFALSLTGTTWRRKAKDLAHKQAELSQRLATVVHLNTKSQNTVHFDM